MSTCTCPRCGADTPTILQLQGGGIGCQACFKAGQDEVVKWIAAEEYEPGQALEDLLEKPQPKTTAADPPKGPGHPFLANYLEQLEDGLPPMQKPLLHSLIGPHPPIHPPSCPIHVVPVTGDDIVKAKKLIDEHVTFTPYKAEAIWMADEQAIDIDRIMKDPADFDEAFLAVKIEGMIKQHAEGLQKQLVEAMLAAAGATAPRGLPS